MNDSKLSINTLTIVTLLFSAILLFFVMAASSFSTRIAVNDYYPIEGTDFAIVYSNRRENGIYEGSEQTGTLRVEGSFGHDWGVALEEPYLFVNEYSYTAMGLIHSNVVRINLLTFEKEVLFGDAVLRGRCLSGELVCVTGFLMPATFPETNSMCRLYAMADGGGGAGGSRVVFLDPSPSEPLCELDYDGDEDGFEDAYVNRTLEDVLEEVGA